MKQVRKLLFYLHGCGGDKIVLTILQFLSAWTWHFNSTWSFSKSQHIVFRNQIHYTFCPTCYKCCSHIHIWCSCLFSAFCWAFFMLFQLLRVFWCHFKYDSLEIVTIENWLHIVFFPTTSYWKHTVCYLVPTLSSLKWNSQRIHKSFCQWVLSIHGQLKKKKKSLHI